MQYSIRFHNENSNESISVSFDDDKTFIIPRVGDLVDLSKFEKTQVVKSIKHEIGTSGDYDSVFRYKITIFCENFPVVSVKPPLWPSF